MPSRPEAEDRPSSAKQIATAMATLGIYAGANTPAEHAAEARRLGREATNRLHLVNVLLGAAQAEVLVTESLPVSTDDRLAAYEQQVATAWVADSPTRRLRATASPRRWHHAGPAATVGNMRERNGDRGFDLSAWRVVSVAQGTAWLERSKPMQRARPPATVRA